MPCVKGRAKAASGAAMCFNDLMAARGVANVVAADRERDTKTTEGALLDAKQITSGQ